MKELLIQSILLIGLKSAGLLKKENADLVVFDWWHPFFGFCHGVISFLIQKKYKNKILFITENVVSHEANAIDKFLTRIGLKFASKFLTLSGIVEKEVQQYSKGKKVYRSNCLFMIVTNRTKN